MLQLKSHYYIYRWKLGKNVPFLEVLLQACHLAGVPAVEFFSGKIPASILPKRKSRITKGYRLRKNFDWLKAEKLLKASLKENPPPSLLEMLRRTDSTYPAVRKRFPSLFEKIIKRHEHHKSILDKRLRQRVQKIIDSNEYPPPSKQKVIQRLNTYTVCLDRVCPDLCSLLSERYWQHRKKQAMAKKVKLLQQIRKIANMLHGQGIYPSFPKVIAHLASPGLLTDEDARNALRDIQRALGYRR
jgi:transcriptional regulator with XRE-family HTH domain